MITLTIPYATLISPFFLTRSCQTPWTSPGGHIYTPFHGSLGCSSMSIKIFIDLINDWNLFVSIIGTTLGTGMGLVRSIWDLQLRWPNKVYFHDNADRWGVWWEGGENKRSLASSSGNQAEMWHIIHRILLIKYNSLDISVMCLWHKSTQKIH